MGRKRNEVARRAREERLIGNDQLSNGKRPKRKIAGAIGNGMATRFQKGNTAAAARPMTEEQARTKIAVAELAKVAGVHRKNHWPKRRITEAMQRQLSDMVEIDGKFVRKDEAIVEQVMLKALAGDLGAFDRIADRVEGRPNQAVQVTSTGAVGVVSVTMNAQEAARLYAQSVRGEDDDAGEDGADENDALDHDEK